MPNPTEKERLNKARELRIEKEKQEKLQKEIERREQVSIFFKNIWLIFFVRENKSTQQKTHLNNCK